MIVPGLADLHLWFAFGAGAATFFAPCAYPLLPGYVAFFLGTDDDTSSRGRLLARAVAVGVIVSVGFFFVYAALAGIVVAIGARALSNVSVLELLVGTGMIVLGTAMSLGWSFSSHVQLPERRRSATGFLLFGVVYAAAAAGCTAPLFIGVAINGIAAGPVAGIATLAAYASGMSALMIAITLLAALGRDQLVRRLSANTGRIRRASGVLLVVAGIAQIWMFLFWFDGLATLGLA